MVDQAQARVLEKYSPCLTPNLDRLAARGIRFTRAYTPSPVCSPARASLMTGLLPHNHGVLYVTNTVDKDQSVLREHAPHWAQMLLQAGYRTMYFGKWHVEHTEAPHRFGWELDGSETTVLFRNARERNRWKQLDEEDFSLSRYFSNELGYDRRLHYGVTRIPPEQRDMGIITSLAYEHLKAALEVDRPWCCVVSIPEPHDPFVAGHETYQQYRLADIQLAPNRNDNLSDRPSIYRRTARIWQDMSETEHRQAAACYYASITEIDQMFGRIIDLISGSEQMEKTFIIFTADHGELLGAHGLYFKHFCAFEEVYTIPLVVTGPSIARGATLSTRVGLHDVAPTILELAGLTSPAVADCRSFAQLLKDPEKHIEFFPSGYAEHYGTRYLLTQRVYWENDWKYVFNGFDFDELYNLAADPYELHNLAHDPDHAEISRKMMRGIWDKVKKTGDTTLANTGYPSLRIAPVGPQ